MARRNGSGGRGTTTAPQRMTKAERKEQARKDRLELQRKQERRKRRRLIGIIVGSVLVAGAIAAIVLVNVNAPPLPGMMTTQATTANPWPPNSKDALTRADKIGLPASGSETFHHHDLLQIYVHGESIPVPADIGVTPNGGASMHTHDTSGIMHLETDTPYNFKLGQFFDVWGLRFDDTCIGGYCSNGADQLRVYVNGKQITSNARNIPLTQHEDVVVTFGTTGQLPQPIPKTYSKSISSVCAPTC